MNEKFITIVGFRHYYGKHPFHIGSIIKCKKEPDNAYDMEAIKAILPYIGTVGYIANSPYTVAEGTMSAGRIYDRVRDKFYVRVLFMTQSKIICRLEKYRPDDLEREIAEQMKETGDKDYWD